MNVKLSFHGKTAIMTLARPEARNALNAEMIKNIEIVIDQILANKAQALIVTGEGHKAFCAGADITELQNKTADEYLELSRKGQTIFHKISHLDIPSVAVIQGAVLGGGLELAMACTFRICNPDAKFGLPEVKLGVIPGYGGTQRLPRLIGQSRAIELIASGRIFTAEEAERIGLVHQIIEIGDPVTAGLSYLSKFGTTFPVALKCILKSVQSALDLNMEQGLELEAAQFQIAIQSQDAAEGIQAFIEKRTAQFMGQ